MRARVAVGILAAVLSACAAPAPPTPSPLSPSSTQLPSLPLRSPGIFTFPPTPTPTPTQAPTPTPTLNPTKLFVSEEDIGAQLDALMQIATENNGIRAAGTPGYDESADYVVDQLTALGYEVKRVPFDFTFFDETAPVELSVGDQAWSGGEWLHSMLYAGQGEVSATLQSVQLTADGTQTGTGGCDFTEWSDFVRDNIAVIESGPCFRYDQIMNAQKAGAAAVISLYPHWEANNTRRPTLVFPGDVTIPAIVAGGEPSTAILAALAAGGSARLNVQVMSEPRTNDDVIADWPGASDDVVMLGSHLDSVLDGPGINDNGSGVATLLALAKSVAQTQSAKSIRFGFWGAEEFGDIGSSGYVNGLGSTEIGRIKAYFNLDMVASPNPARYVYGDSAAPPGSDALVQSLMDALTEAGKPGVVTDIGGSSDHFWFEQVGIPSAGVFSGLSPLTDEEAAMFGGQAGVPADACYHLACDTRDNIDLASAVILGNAVASVVKDLAYQ